MIRSLHIARTGLDSAQSQLDVISNNLANVSTNGYKRTRAIFQDLLYQNIRQPGAQSSQQTQVPVGLQLGTGAKLVSTEKIHTQGNLTRTDNSLDFAINGNGFFQVLLPDGTIGYTRDGAFQKDNTGQLVTSDGYPLQPSITLPENTTSVTVSNDGVVSITQSGQNGSTNLGNIPLVNFVNVGGLQSMGANIYVETASSGTPNVAPPGTNGLGVINQGYVETSNVNVAEELVTMIQAQRAFELNSKVVSTTDQMLAKLTNL